MGAYGLIDENGSRANQYEWDATQKNNILAAYLNRYLVLKKEPERETLKDFEKFIHPILDDLLDGLTVEPLSEQDFYKAHP